MSDPKQWQWIKHFARDGNAACAQVVARGEGYYQDRDLPLLTDKSRYRVFDCFDLRPRTGGDALGQMIISCCFMSIANRLIELEGNEDGDGS
jgi:hypothetical protein